MVTSEQIIKIIGKEIKRHEEPITELKRDMQILFDRMVSKDYESEEHKTLIKQAKEIKEKYKPLFILSEAEKIKQDVKGSKSE